MSDTAAFRGELEVVKTNLFGLGHNVRGIDDKVSRVDQRLTELDAYVKQDGSDKATRLMGAVEVINGVNRSLNAIHAAVAAGQGGDVIGVASHSLTAVGTLLKAGAGAAMTTIAAGNPAAPIIALVLYIAGTIVELAASIVEFFRKTGPSLTDQMKELLIRARATELQGELSHSLRVFQDWHALLQVGSRQNASWADLQSEVNLLDGNAVTFTRHAFHWLCEPEHQKVHDAWVAVFDAYSTAMYLESLVYFKQFASSLNYKAEQLHRTGWPGQDVIDNDADTHHSMKIHFSGVRADFRKLHWIARRMAPIWLRASDSKIYSSGISFRETIHTPAGPRIAQRDADWTNVAGPAHAFRPVWRNEQVSGGTILWVWNADNVPHYVMDGQTTRFDGFGSRPIHALDVAFLGDAEPPEPADPDATPVPWAGVHVLLALHETTVPGLGPNALDDPWGGRDHPGAELKVMYFAPDRGLQYKDLPKNSKNTFRTPEKLHCGRDWNVSSIKCIRLHIDKDNTVRAYALMVEKAYSSVLFSDEKTSGGWGPVIHGTVERIYVNETAVWAMGGQKIWWRAHDTAKDWQELDPPPDLGTRTYTDIHPGDDGLLIACVGDTYFGYTKEDGWRAASERGGWAADRMARLPLGGFAMFNAAWEAAKSWEEMAEQIEKDNEKSKQ